MDTDPTTSLVAVARPRQRYEFGNRLGGEVDRVFANPASTSNDRVRAMGAYRMARDDLGAVLEADNRAGFELGSSAADRV